MHAFLCLGTPSTHFATQILRLLTDERQSPHRERANATRSQISFVVGDLVMARVQVTSNTTTGIFAKLAYCKHSPHAIVESTGHGAYVVYRYGHPDVPLLKYPTQFLSALPPALLPCASVDISSDFRYLSHSHAPLPHPVPNIQMYNNMWFTPSLSTHHPPAFDFVDSADAISSPSLVPNSAAPFVPIVSIPADAAIPITYPRDDPVLPLTPAIGAALSLAISSSTDYLFFMSYRPAGTLFGPDGTLSKLIWNRVFWTLLPPIVLLTAAITAISLQSIPPIRICPSC
jgi:hypothetical protein